MSFRIERDEPIPDAVRRIAAEEIDGAQADRALANREAAVHSIRKRFKRLRALMRLVGDVPNGKVHDAMLRDAGGTLAQARDHRVACDTARRLGEVGGEAGPALDRLVLALAFRGPAEPDLGATLQALGGPLAAMRQEVTGWTLGGWQDASGPVAALAPALRKTYQRGRARYAEAHAWPTADHLHEWRKRVKDLWYQLTLLDGVDPSLRPVIDDLDTLGDTLGLDHDHAVLDALVVDGSLCPDDDRRVVHEALAAERDRLQAIARPLGARLFASEPDDFVAGLLRST